MDFVFFFFFLYLDRFGYVQWIVHTVLAHSLAQCDGDACISKFNQFIHTKPKDEEKKKQIFYRIFQFVCRFGAAWQQVTIYVLCLHCVLRLGE